MPFPPTRTLALRPPLAGPSASAVVRWAEPGATAAWEQA